MISCIILIVMKMKVVICTNRHHLSELFRESLKDDVESFENISINDETLDNIYKLNPDLIFFDVSIKGNKKWQIIETLTTAPSLRDSPLILIFSRKNKNQVTKMCDFDIFDYLIEPLLKCEIKVKVFKAHEIVELKKEFSKLLTKDPLTGAYNRSFLMERIQEELNWCSLYKEPLSLAIFDIDFFKKINDTYGHLTGDRVLMELVSLAVEFLPDMFIIGRYGGEEFCILMPSVDEQKAKEICEQFRKKVEESEFHTFSGQPIKCTISIGFTTFYGEERIVPDEIIQKADIALYKAKQSGRNRVIFEPFIVE